jgi:hypothetical protein
MAEEGTAAPPVVTSPPTSDNAPAPSAPATSEVGASGEQSEQSLIGTEPAAPVGADGFKYVGDDGQFVPDWSKHLPEDFGDFRNKLANYRNPVQLAKALHSANQTISKKGIIPPTPQSTEAEVSAYRKQMGVPDKPEGYLEGVEIETAEGIPFNKEIAGVYMEVAHKHHIPAAAMQDLLAVNKKQAEIQLAAEQQRVAEARSHGLEQLRQVWRADFANKLGMAKKGVVLEKGNPYSFGFQDPEVVRIIAGLTGRLGEDVIAGVGEALPQGTHELRATAMDIIQNPANKDYQKYRSGDPDVRSRVRRMLEQSESTIRR